MQNLSWYTLNDLRLKLNFELFPGLENCESLQIRWRLEPACLPALTASSLFSQLPAGRPRGKGKVMSMQSVRHLKMSTQACNDQPFHIDHAEGASL